jgi:PAS domain S-box-containing protein
MSTDTPSRDDGPHAGSWADERMRDRGATLSELEDLLVKGAAAVIATDLDGVITHWSAGAERLYGWGGEEAIGQPILDLLVARRNHPVGEQVIDAIRRTGSWVGEFEVCCKDGGIVLAYVRGALVKDDAGRSVGILGLSMDADAPPLPS